MARAIWSGSISFGLVNIPIKVQTAVSEKDIHFNMLHAKDGARIKMKRFCPEEDREVDNDEIVKGYEVSRGQYVTFTPEELESADPEAARTIDIQEFVELADIDPAYFDRPYYLVPDKNADKPYALLTAALEKTGKVGIARVVMREKEYLVALRVNDGVLMMETMHFADEVIAPSVVAEGANIDTKTIDKKQLALAEQLIESLTEEFDPKRHRNEHREKLLAMIEKKTAGHKVVVEPAAKVMPKTKDILAALEESLSHVRSRTHGRRREGASEAEGAATVTEQKPLKSKAHGSKKVAAAKKKARAAA